MTRILIALIVVFGASVSADDADDLLRADAKAGHLASMRSQQQAASTTQNAGHAYQIGIGVYGAYEPSIFPTETWIDIACFAAPGQDYPRAWSLMYVDVRLYRSGVLVWDSSRLGRDRGICDISRGVYTTYVEIPRGLRFDNWTVFVTESEQRSMGVQTGPRVYRRDDFPSWCESDRWRCEPATARYQNPAHVYR